MLSFIYTPVYWFILALEWALRFAGWEAFVNLKSETETLADGGDYPRDFWSIGSTLPDEHGNVEAWGLGLHAVLSPCERIHFWRCVQRTIVSLPSAVLMVPVRLAGWGLFVERDAPGFGFLNTRLEGSRQSWEFWGFGLHILAGNDRAFYRRWAAVRRQDDGC